MKAYNYEKAYSITIHCYTYTALLLSILALSKYLDNIKLGILLIISIFTIGLITGLIYEKN